MQRRLISALVAVVLAGIGTLLLFNWVSAADARAMAGQQPTSVLVVVTQIPPNTLGSQVGLYVETRQIPASAIVPGALTSLDSVKDLATTTQLEVGEQILPSRFAQPDTSDQGGVKVPNNMQLLTVPLDAAHAAGGALQPGDKVAAYVTVAVKDQTKNQMLLPQILVVSATADSVTLALAPKDVQKVMLGTQNNLWLVVSSKESASTSPMSMKQILE
jgi:pilus assembly protein CpaB